MIKQMTRSELFLITTRAMAPERRDEIVGLGLKTIVSGALVTCMTGAVAGIVGAL